MFGSFGASFGSFGSGVGGLLPSFTNITSWLRSPTTDGKTLANSKGTDANLTGVNCIKTNNNASHTAIMSTGQLFTTGSVFSADILVHGTTGGTNLQVLLGHSSVNANFLLREGVPRFRTNGLVNDLPFSTLSVSDNVNYNIKFERTADDTLVCTLTNLETGAVTSETGTLTGTAQGSYMGANPLNRIGSSGSIKSKIKFTNVVFNDWKYPLQEGSGTKCFDIGGEGNHITLGADIWDTAESRASHNHEYGFDTDIFKGYEDYWSIASSGSGTWTINESNLTLTGNTGTSGRVKQVVEGMASGETLVVSGTITQTTGQGGGSDIAISSNSAGWSEGSVFLGGQIGTYTFSTTLNANSSTCDIQFVALGGANLVISDLKFTVVKKIPALNTKTKQVATFDGEADRISTGYIIPDFTTLTYTTRFKAHTLHQGLLVSNRDANSFRFIDIQLEASGNITIKYRSGSQSFITHSFTSAYSADTLYDLTYTIRSSDASGSISIQEVGGSINSSAFDFDNIPDLSSNDVRIGQENHSNNLEFDGEMHSAKLVVDSSTKFEYDFQNDIGTTTVQDLSTNNNDGDVTVGNGGTETFWGTRVADTAGSLVSADYATGNLTISNPAGFVHNGSECGVDMVSNDLTSTELFNINNATATTTFVRKDNGNIVQILDYSDPLTGDDLTRTRNYVG